MFAQSNLGNLTADLIHTQSLEIDYSVTIRAIVMKLSDNQNLSPKYCETSEGVVIPGWFLVHK